MSWAHAVSQDLVHWKHLPLAIPEDEKNMIFSGSCVTDINNTSGFATKRGQVPFVAIYTAHIIPDKTKPDDYFQNQLIAYSLDNGRTWKKYVGNPVLDLHKKDFRDPFVFWHEQSKKWVMCVVLPHEHIVQFYGSSDLKKWSHLSDFGPAGDTTDIWECPSMMQVPVQGQPGKSKWVLFNSQQTAMQYFVGEFDGISFHNENPGHSILRPDYGPDYYAAVVYNGIPPGHSPILLGWANNWTYAQSIPTSPWRSAMSLPRELSLKKTDSCFILLQQPVAALRKLRREWKEYDSLGAGERRFTIAKGDVVEMEIVLKPPAAGATKIELASGSTHSFIIGYNSPTQKLFIDRSRSGNTGFHKDFSNWLFATTDLPLQKGQLRLHIFFDKSIVEIFANEGEKVMTAQVFPYPGDLDIQVSCSSNEPALFEHIKIWTLASAWN